MSGDVLDVSVHSGVISYEPTELVVTVRAGTLMTDLVDALGAEGQCLPFEPPQTVGSTIGGVLACGLSGPARPFTGSARDYVLGMRIVNGLAEDLSFGGEVMKNVAGYDVSRLQVGAYGTLGVLLDTSMKVLPIAESSLTLQREASSTADLSELIALSRQALPITGLFRLGSTDTIRLAGSASAVHAAKNIVGGEQIDDGDRVWAELRELSQAFFTGHDAPLWRFSVPAHAPLDQMPETVMYDWGGAQRWVRSTASADDMHALAKSLGGHATNYSPGNTQNAGFQPLEPGVAKLHRRLRDSFDPHRLFNPGRFQPDVDL